MRVALLTLKQAKHESDVFNIYLNYLEQEKISISITNLRSDINGLLMLLVR